MRRSRSNGLSVAIGLCAACTGWAQVNPDFDGDGVVSPADIARYVTTWSDCVSNGNHCAGVDVDGDGAVLPDDLAAFVHLWFDAVQNAEARGGWTALEPRPGARVIYVSSSDGKSTNSGLSSKAPELTLDQGVALLRDGYPDQLLLKKGDTWTGQTFGDFRKSGRSATDRMVIASYGIGPRPKVIPPTWTYAFSRGIGGSKGDLAVVGVHFQAAPRDEFQYPCINIYEYPFAPAPFPIADILFEDCRFTRFYAAGLFQMIDRLTIRRCILEDICTPAPAQSSAEVYFDFCSNLLLEENYVVNRVLGVVRECYERDLFFYVNDGNPGPVNLRRNICINKGPVGPMGFMVRANAVIDDNVLDGMNMGINVGGQDTPPSGLYPGGTHYHIGGNVVTRGLNMNSAPGGERAIGVEIGFVDTLGTIVENNIIANKGVVVGDGSGIRFDQFYYEGYANNVTVQNNIVYDWSGLDVNRGPAPVTGLKFFGNFVQNPDQIGSEMPLVDLYSDSPLAVAFSGNTYSSRRSTAAWFRVDDSNVSQPYWLWTEPSAVFQTVNYPAPGRSLAGYMQSLGLPGTIDGAIDAVLTQSRDTWNDQYAIDAILTYLRAGFGR